jgi:hypothetical protein
MVQTAGAIGITMGSATRPLAVNEHGSIAVQRIGNDAGIDREHVACVARASPKRPESCSTPTSFTTRAVDYGSIGPDWNAWPASVTKWSVRSLRACCRGTGAKCNRSRMMTAKLLGRRHKPGRSSDTDSRFLTPARPCMAMFAIIQTAHAFGRILNRARPIPSASHLASRDPTADKLGTSSCSTRGATPRQSGEFHVSQAARYLPQSIACRVAAQGA